MESVHGTGTSSEETLKATPENMDSKTNVLSQDKQGGEIEDKFCTDVHTEVVSSEQMLKSTPVKMYTKPNIFTQGTPQKYTGSQSSQSESSEKTPTKLKTHDLKHIQEKIDKFCGELDTEFKACLYSVMKQDTTDTSKSLERLRRKTKAFNKEISFSLDVCIKDTAAIIQNQGTLKQYANFLHKEKDELQKEIDNLKKQRALQELQDMESLLNESDDDDDEFCSSVKKIKTEEVKK